MSTDRLVSHQLSTYYAPRGRQRIYDLGIQLSQIYLHPDDRLIGIMGDPGCGKSALVRGMFPGLELTNDDDGVNVRPLPLLEEGGFGFFKPHTYHVDIRFEQGFSSLSTLADAIMEAVHNGKRVVVEHFELVYPLLPINADLLIGIGEEIVVTRPSLFGPEPQELYDSVHRSLPYRLMAHSAEDLVELFLPPQELERCSHGDIRHGFILYFPDTKPEIDPKLLQEQVDDLIAQDLPITYADDHHITIGDRLHVCTGPRTHVRRTGQIENFRLLYDLIYDRRNRRWLLLGGVGPDSLDNLKKLEGMQRVE